MAFASTNVLMVDWVYKSVVFYRLIYCHLLSQRESQLPPASQEVLQDQQVHLTQAHFQLLPLHWGLEHVRFSSSPLRVESLFALLCFLQQSCWPLKPAVLGLIFLAQDPRAAEPDVGLRLLNPWGEPVPLVLSSCM